jgi:hypothetical protein
LAGVSPASSATTDTANPEVTAVADGQKLPEWLTETTRKDWLRNAYAISKEQWADLDWSRAWVDMGPSPTGNLGPYRHVPLKGRGERRGKDRAVL